MPFSLFVYHNWMAHNSKTTKVTTSVQENFFVYWEKSIKWYQYLYIYPKSKIVVRTGPAQWSKLRQEHKKWFLWLQWSKVVRKRVVATFSDVNICWIIPVLLRNSEKWHLLKSGPPVRTTSRRSKMGQIVWAT